MDTATSTTTKAPTWNEVKGWKVELSLKGYVKQWISEGEFWNLMVSVHPPAAVTCYQPVCEGQASSLLFSLVYDEQQVLGLAKLPAKPRKRHTGGAWGGGTVMEMRGDWSFASRWQTQVGVYSLCWELRRQLIERTQENVTAAGCRHTIDDDTAAFVAPGWRRPASSLLTCCAEGSVLQPPELAAPESEQILYRKMSEQIQSKPFS